MWISALIQRLTQGRKKTQKLRVIGHDELHDALLFLDRLSLVAMSLTNCRFSPAVARLPPNACLLRVQEVRFSMKPERLVRVTRRFRHLGDYDVLKPLEYTLRIRFDDFFANNKAVKEVIRAYNDPQTVLEVLKHTLKIVSASTVRIEVNTSLFDVSRLAQREDERCGMVGTLNTSIDMPNVDPSVFENLPLICGRVAELRFEHECRHSVSLSQQTDRFLRNCIARNVRELEIANYRSHHAPLDGHCDVSEESLLDFCFGRHLSFVGEEKPVVSLWLDWIHLSDQFLNRFIEASEASDSDHSVHLYLRGRDVHDQDLSMCRKAPVLASTSKDYRTGTFTFYGRKHAVRVGYNPKLHYLLVERKDLSSREQFFVESRDFLYEGNGVWKYHVDRWVIMF